MSTNVMTTAVLGIALAVTAVPAHGEPERLLACEKPHVDVGEIGVRQQNHTFTLRNPSKQTVQITATEKACGCVKREFSTYRLAPGETSELTLDFPIRTKPGAVGDFLERLEIYVNNEHDAPALVVSVPGRLVPVAYRLRDGIYIEAPQTAGKEFTGRIELFLNKVRGVKIESIETLGDLPIDARIVKREDALTAGEERVVLEVKGTLQTGIEIPATASVVLKLNNDDMPEMGIPVTLYKKRGHEIRFSPQQVAFGVVSADAKVKKTIVVELPKSANYSVENAEPGGEGVKVTIKENPKATHVVLLRCELDASSVVGAVEQELLVRIAVPGGPSEVYKLPISGFVKPAEKKQASKE
ncbi:MAG TPA: DUF1573 domain-containing protein [Pirellulales bacterium]|nr:DUF1573 domain-containing protein [Pirellulales bacterium]